MRLKMPREFYIPKNAERIQAPDSSAVAYLSTGNAGAFYAIGFSGKRNKPDFNYRFRSEQQAREHIAQHAAGVRQRDELMAKRRADRTNVRAADHYKVGDILYTSWGYEQTNVEFFKVVRVLEKAVEVVAIGASVEETGFMSGETRPNPDIEIRDGYWAEHNGIKRVQGDGNGGAYVRIHDHSGGYKLGARETVHCSWYH